MWASLFENSSREDSGGGHSKKTWYGLVIGDWWLVIGDCLIGDGFDWLTTSEFWNEQDKKEAEVKKVEEMNGVLSNPLLALVAQEVLQNPNYISDLKADLEKSDNKVALSPNLMKLSPS
jgi:hypothetical protein